MAAVSLDMNSGEDAKVCQAAAMCNAIL